MRDARNDERRGRGNVNPIDILEGFLLDDLAAATHPLTGATTASLQVIRWDADDNFYETDLVETITNRSLTFSASAASDYRDTADVTTAVFVNGEWRPLVGSGGGTSCTRVRFQVIVADAVTRTALCAIVSRPYGCGVNDIPDTVLNGEVVEICDPAGCFFNDPNDLLSGREGWAEYMMPVSGSTFCQDGNYVLVGEWQVYSLCCATDRCNL